jgi:hypothetical protein
LPILYKAVNLQGIAVNMDDVSMADIMETEGEQPVGATGTGILSIARYVLELMPFPWFEPSPVAISEGHYGGHDMYFCAKAAAQGFSIAVDSHITMYAEHVGFNRIGVQHYLAEVKTAQDAYAERQGTAGANGSAGADGAAPGSDRRLSPAHVRRG